MALNLQYSPEPSLQEGFLDKSTGLPLSFGLVFFYSDVNRTTLKPIYTLSGSPPNYTYTQLPNPVILSGIGTIQDGNGNDVIPYFFPFDANGNTELYYIVVTDQFGVQQFTRQGLPNVGSNVTPIIANFSENFIPNGQFLLWNPPASYSSTKYTFNFGGIIGSTDVIDVAPGGWTFQVTAGSTTTYTISFNQLLAAVLTPPASPRYEIEIIRSSPTGADNICDLRIRFMDVNKFQSTGVNDTWTLLFNAEAASTLSNVTIHLIKYFGTSGSSATPADVTEDIVWGGPINITTSQQTFAVANSFGINTGKTIGNNNNDFIEFAVRFPASALQTFNVKLTDFVLVNQNITQAQASSVDFPATTNGEFVLQALSNLAPTTTSNTTTNYYQEDGSNLYLPMIMTQKGYTYDYGEIGTIVAETSLSNYTGSVSNITNRIICDGSQYKVSNYSILGIPYRRLFKRIFSSFSLISPWGSGANFVNALIYTLADPTEVFLLTNKPGLQTNPADGTTPTGFTFNSKVVSGSASINLDAWSNGFGTIIIRGIVIGLAAASPVDGTGGLITSTTITDIAQSNYQLYLFVNGNAAALSAGGGNPAKYFSISSTTTQYSFWFNVAGETANGPGTRIEVQLSSTMNISGVTAVLTNTINRYQFNSIITVAGGAIPASAFFTFNANGVTYSPWFKKSGVGTPPSTANPIEIDINGTETAAQIALLLITALNSEYFQVPDLRGLFLRGYDPNAVYDNKAVDRGSKVYNANPSIEANTFELGFFTIHKHSPLSPGTSFIGNNLGAGSTGGGGDLGGAATTAATGGYETRPVNESVIWVIKY